MVNLVIVKNPFKTDKEIKQVDFVPEKSAFSYVQPEMMGNEVVISHNGRIIDETEHESLVPVPGDYIAVCPVIEGGGGGGKDVGRTLAIIALGIVTMGVGSMVAGGAFWGLEAIGAANWGFWSWVAAAGTYAAGGYLINQAFPAQQGAERAERKQVYGWSRMSPISTEGEAIPVTFGTVRMGVMAPIQMLTQRVTTDGEKQYLNLLMSSGEGPIDSITDLKINDNPYNYFDGVNYETRLGTNDQTVISNFNDTYFPTSLNYKLEESTEYTTHQLAGTYSGLEVVVNLPGGLYRVDGGEIKSNEVRIIIRHRKIGNSTWVSWGTKTIKGKYTHAIQRVYSEHDIPEGEYEVQVRCSYVMDDGEQDAYDIYWTSVSGIIYDDFAYPNKALVGLKALATDQLSGGIPRISWTQTRNSVWVWNPSTSTYEQKPANNPAWACYDIIHRCRKIKDINTGTDEYVVNGIPANRIDYQAFADWAAFCEDREIEYNGIIYNIQTLWDALKSPEQAGRGRVIQRGTKFSCVCDAPSEPVQMFTVSNTGLDSFKEEFLGTQDRSNALELTFFNVDNNYEEQTIPIYGPDYDEATAIENPTQVRIGYAMTLEQAYRYGAYQLRVNHYINRAVTWGADIDAIACQAGDVVLLQHDVPRWGTGGRLESASIKENYFLSQDFPALFVEEVNDKVKLDKEVTLLPDTNYAIMIRYSDDTLVEKTIESVTEETTTDTLTVTVPFETIPQEGDIFSFGEVEKVAKPFRLVSISRDDDFRCTLQGMEYIEEVYTEAADVPLIDYTRSTGELPDPWAPPDSVQDLQVVESHKTLKDGTWLPTMKVSWGLLPNQIFTQYANIYYSSDNGATWNFDGRTEELKYTISDIETGDYIVKVQAESKGGIKEDFDSAPEIEITVNGKMGITETPTVTGIAGGLRGLTVFLEKPAEKDWAGFEIYASETSGFTPSPSNFGAGGKQLMLPVPGLKPGVTYYLKIRMSDESGNYSDYIDAQGVTDGETVSSTIVIAAANSSEKGKAGADYVCEGTVTQQVLATGTVRGRVAPTSEYDAGIQINEDLVPSVVPEGVLSGNYYVNFTSGTLSGQTYKINETQKDVVGDIYDILHLEAFDTDVNDVSQNDTFEVLGPVAQGSDQTIINQAINSLPSGGKVVLLEGTFVVDGGIALKSNIILEGQGNSTIIKLKDFHNAHIDIIGNQDKNNSFSNIKIKNLCIDGNSDNQDWYIQEGVSFDSNYSIKNITVEGLTIKNIRTPNNSIYMGKNVTGSNIINNDINSGGGICVINYCIVSNNNINNSIIKILGKRNTVQGNNLINSSISVDGSAYIMAPNNNLIKGNIVSGGEIYVGGPPDLDYQPRYNQISENTVRKETSSQSYGLRISFYADYNLVINNDLYDSGNTAAIQGTSTTEYGAGNRVNDGSWLVGADG